MNTDNPTKNYVAIACELVGGTAALAALCDVTGPAVSQWISGFRRVPAERCPLIEKATGGKVKCKQLRPDVAWDVLRQAS